VIDEDTPVASYGIDVPSWIDEDVSLNDIDAIYDGGCASGAYMPAVVYWQARETMAAHGDDVLVYIEDVYGDLPPVPRGESWSGIAVHYLSIAVELWAGSVRDEARAAFTAAQSPEGEE
jgi:hypothetical protein